MIGAVADRIIAEAGEHYGAGRLQQADALCRDLLKADPDHVQALNLAAVIAFVTDRAAEGAALLHRVFNLEPDNARAFGTLGRALVAKGEHQGAVDAFQQALLSRPQDGDLHVKLGKALCALNRCPEAEVAYRRAIELDPALIEAHFSLGNLLAEQGRLNEAADVYRALIARGSESVAALVNLGNVLMDQGAYSEAVEVYQHSVVLRPDFAAGYRNLALALQQDGRFEDALAACAHAMSREPEDVNNHIVMGDVLLALDRAEEAVALYRQALHLAPDNAKLHCNLGVALHRQGELKAARQSNQQQFSPGAGGAGAPKPSSTVLRESPELAEALHAYRRAIVLNPRDARIFTNLAACLRELGRPDDALQAYRDAIALDPNDARTFADLSACFCDLERFDEAKEACQRALSLDPGNPFAHINLGFVYEELDDLEAVVAANRRAVAADPGCAKAYTNLGVALGNIGKVDESIAALRRAVEISPDNATCHYNYAHSLLAAGDFTNGFQEFEWRIKYRAMQDGVEVFARPEWQGEHLNGRTLLLHAEYGFGDTLQFVRYVPRAATMGGPIVLQVQPALAELLRSSFPGVVVVARGEALPPFDLHLPLMSLSRVFGTTLDSIPADVPYLSVDPAKLARYRQAIAGESRLKVGVNWAGNPRFRQDRRRSLSAEAVLPHLLVPGVQLFSLQKEPKETDRSVLKSRKGEIVELGPSFNDFSDTAAAIDALDLVITTDTSVAHLAGSLGHPTWVLLPYVLDWRWLRDRQDSPWYPTMRLFRQQRPFDWRGVFERLPGELARVVAGERHLLLPPNSNPFGSVQ
jgi:tetratricopeptide (TPR) repeat protein